MAEDVARGRKRHNAADAEAFSCELFAHRALCQLPVDIRIFPKACEESLCRPFSYGDAVAAGEYEDGSAFLAACFERGFYGIVLLRTAVMRKAEAGGRACVTERCAVRKADRRAKIHKGFVEVSCISSRRVGGSERRFESALACVLCDIDTVCSDARSDAQKVAVDGRARLTVGKGRDGARGIAADAGKGKQRIEVAGQLPAVFADDRFGGAFEIARAAVIAESLPEFHQCIVIACGEVGDRRQGIEEAEIVGTHDGGTCLLEHDLRDPDMIGRRLIAPRQIARVGRRFAPRKQCIAENGEDGVPRPR